VLLRTTPLPAGARAVLDAAAVVGTTFDVQDALAAAGEACWPEQLAGRGLVTAVDNGRAAFRHALTRDAVYTEIAWSQRRALHRAVAERLAAGRAPALAAAHLLAAGEPDRARPALVTAAGDYIAVHAYRDAARVLRCALELWPSGAAAATGRLDVVERLASCATMCADHAEAVTLLRELVDGRRQGGETVALAAALRRLALAHELLGHWDAALEHHEAAAVAFSDGGLRAEAALERLAAAVHLRAAASYSAALDSVEAARADAAAAGAGELRLRLDGLRGNVLARHGQVEEGVAAVRAALDEALAAGLPGPAAELHQRLADALEHAGDYPGAVATYAAGYRYCDTHGQDATGALCRACVTVVLFSSGRWDEAAEVCRDVLEELGGAHSHAVTAGILGLVHAMRGEAELARPHLLHGRALATRIELAAVELLCTWGLAVLADQSGAHDEAADHGRRVLERWDGTQEAHYVVPVLQWTATLFAESGLAVETRRCAAALSRVAEAAARPEALAALAHALGETALLEGSPRAVDELTRAVDLLADRDLPLATALARRRAAAALAAHGQRDRAAALLRAAHDTGRLLRAAPFTARVTADLRALGETAPRGDAGRDAGRGTGLGAGLNAGPGRPAGPAGAAGLSRRELEVLRLVARGRTSRAIAGELFLSPRTVEMHVTNGMRKLACRTRAEAVRRLTELSLIGGPTTS
jgi:DNA-binding CsgD family transcriptional regulator/tetratricopeptide (TPR) repeat protein